MSNSVPSRAELNKQAPYRDEELLQFMYVEQGHTPAELANRWNCTPPTIRRYLHKYEIGDYGDDVDQTRIKEDTANTVTKTTYHQRDHLVVERPNDNGTGGHGSPLSVDGKHTFYCRECGSRITVGPDGTEYGHAKNRSQHNMVCPLRDEQKYTPPEVQSFNHHETTYGNYAAKQ